MSGNRELQAADISPPIALKATIPGPTGVYSRVITNASVRYEIPVAAKGNFLSLTAFEDIQIAFGSSDVAVTRDQVSTLTSEALTAVAGTGQRLTAGVEYHWRIPKHVSVTHFAVISDAATAVGEQFYARVSNNIIVDD